MKQTRYVFMGIHIRPVTFSAFSLAQALVKYYNSAGDPQEIIPAIEDEYGNRWHNVKLTATFDEQIKVTA